VNSDLEGWLRFTSISGLGPASQRKLLSAFGSVEAALQASVADVIRVVGARAGDAWRVGADVQAVGAALAWAGAADNHLIALDDPHYPAALLQTADPPLLLYAKGRLELLQQSALAVVGSRSATPAGVRDAESFAEALSDAGLVIVSGLAVGIDAAAHRGGLRGRASSIAVVGTGLDKVYPARHRGLAHELASAGLLLSEFSLGTPPLAANFPRRNRVISGLARGCLVVQAALRSGSLITARQALDQGREVFAIPGSIHSPLSKGCHWLIRQGAKLVESVSDVLDELGMTPESSAPRAADVLDPAAARVLQAMGYEPVDLDTLYDRLGESVETLSTILLQLELDGYLSRLPGALLQRLK
jgi:DNA processing protein